MPLLKQIYERVYVPDSVWKELITPLVEVWVGMPEDVSETLAAYSGKWLVPKPLDERYRGLSRGFGSKKLESLGEGGQIPKRGLSEVW